jgi:glycosyltransferase involved in cell wall biosynthesis
LATDKAKVLLAAPATLATFAAGPAGTYLEAMDSRHRRRTVALVLHSASHSGPARNFASRFHALDHRLHVYTPREGPALEPYHGFAEVHLAPYRRVLMPDSPRAAIDAASQIVREVRTFRRLFRRHAIDTVICATTVTPAAAVAARTLGLSSVIYCGELFETSRSASRGRRFASRMVTRAVPRIADLVICCSDRVAAQFTPDARATVVRLYPPIDRSAPEVDAQEARRRFGLPSDRPVVVSIGLLSPGRGQDVAIYALAQLQEGSTPPALAIVGAPGDGPGDASYAKDLVDLAVSIGLASAVYFMGPVSDIAAVLAAANVFVNPARYEEPFGRAAFEAIAHGVPVIVTRTGAQTELLQNDHSALVVPPDDPVAVARAIRRLLDSPALAGHLVRGAAEPLRALDPDADRERFRELLDSLR